MRFRKVVFSLKYYFSNSRRTAAAALSCLALTGILSGCSAGGNAASELTSESAAATVDASGLPDATGAEDKAGTEGKNGIGAKNGADSKTGADSKDKTAAETGAVSKSGGLADTTAPAKNLPPLSDPALIIKDRISSDGETPHLEPDTSYYFDLDSDGVPEKIRFSLTPENAEGSGQFTLHLYLNEAEVFTYPSLYEYSGAVYITDADTDDSLLEIHCQWAGDSGCMAFYNFIRYEDGTVTNLGDLANRSVLYGEGSLYRSGKTVFHGDGTFSLDTDTPIYASAIGCYYCPLTFALTEGGISEIIQDEYSYRTLVPEGNSPYAFYAAAEFDTFTSADRTEISYHVFPGDRITFEKLKFRDDGSVFALAVNSQGEKGWIYASDGVLFEETPAWG